MTTIIVEGPDFPVTVEFQRRRYSGRQSYCWASVYNGEEVLSLGDPWPGVNWPRRELVRAIGDMLAGKVIAPPAICAVSAGCFVITWSDVQSTRLPNDRSNQTPASRSPDSPGRRIGFPRGQWPAGA